MNDILDTLLTEKMPSKVEGVSPLMRTGWPANKPTVPVVLTVTIPELQLRVLIEFTVRRPKSTMESDPAPPGVANAQFSLDDTAMCELGPLLMFTTLISAGGD